MAAIAPHRFPLWPVAAAAAAYLYWAYFHNREGYDEVSEASAFAIQDGKWPNLQALAAAGVTVTETAAPSKQAAFDQASADPSAVGVKVDATGGGVVYKVLRASNTSHNYFRNYTQFYSSVGTGRGGTYVKVST